MSFNFIRAIEKAPLGAFSFQFYCALKFDMFSLTILKTNFVDW